MKIAALHDNYRDQIESVKTLAATDNLWREAAQALLLTLEQDYQDTDALLTTLHKMQRLHKIRIAGIEHNAALRDALNAETALLWTDFTAPPAADELQAKLADRLYNIRPGMADEAGISLANGSRLIGRLLVEKAIGDDVPFIVQFDDPVFGPLLLNHADEEGVKRLGADRVRQLTPITRLISVREGIAAHQVTPDESKNRILQQETAPVAARTSGGDLFFTLTVIPTETDAAIDGYDYQDYIDLFFEMCDQPWPQIDQAQQDLIAEFNAAKTVRFTNSDGTDIEMDIDGFTFANSLIAKNIPGSEIFSAPRRDSVTGTVVAKGRFEHNGELIENLTMSFNRGYLSHYHADTGQDVFEKAIRLDEGARYIGELGIGTNPHLKKHVANGLLVEKIGGSFHLALGRAYSMTEYEGVPVSLDNGNKSALHWDITTMLHGKDGKIYLDGRLVMDHGKWCDETKYAVLNHGWKAVPEDERPPYWQDKYKGQTVKPSP